MQAGIIIPARLGSSRLPNKVLLPLGGKPLIVRTYENAVKAKGFSAVVVATDSQEVYGAITATGGDAVMTASEHSSGTERCAEAAKNLELDIVVNVQADEPFVDPRDISAIAKALRDKPLAEMATLRIPLQSEEEFYDPNVVKVVCSTDGVALYFSRASIPYDRDNQGFRGGYRHLGVYGYRKEFLIAFAGSTPQKLEELEKLEQLRALDMGAKILLVDAHQAPVSIDTQEDYKRAQKVWRRWRRKPRENQDSPLVSASV